MQERYKEILTLNSNKERTTMKKLLKFIKEALSSMGRPLILPEYVHFGAFLPEMKDITPVKKKAKTATKRKTLATKKPKAKAKTLKGKTNAKNRK